MFSKLYLVQNEKGMKVVYTKERKKIYNFPFFFPLKSSNPCVIYKIRNKVGVWVLRNKGVIDILNEEEFIEMYFVGVKGAVNIWYVNANNPMSRIVFNILNNEDKGVSVENNIIRVFSNAFTVPKVSVKHRGLIALAYIQSDKVNVKVSDIHYFDIDENIQKIYKIKIGGKA